MNRLIENINFLLFEYDFVIVPGLGGFVVNKEDAYINYENQTVCPPHYWTGFNNILTHNDGLLTQLYCTTEAISFPEAEAAIKEDVLNLKKKLFTEKTVMLGNYGKLYLNEAETICFAAIKSSSFIRPTSWGLRKLKLKTLDAIREDNYKSANRTRKRSIQKIAGFVATAVAAVFFFFGISFPISDKKENNTQYASFLPEKMSSVKNAERLEVEKIDNKQTINQQPSDSAHKKEIVIGATKTNSNNNYYLIIGTFQTNAVAKKVLKDFQAKGYDKSGIINGQLVKRIYVASFSNEASANDFKRKFIKTNPKNEDAWVYRR